MLLIAKKWLHDNIVQKEAVTIHTPLLGLGRSLLAFSLLLTLLSTNAQYLFATGLNAGLNTVVYPIEKINFFHLFAPENILWAKWVAIGALVLVISGVLPQLTSIIHWYLAYSFVNASLDIEGGDQIASNLTLMLIPICILDNRLNHWKQYKASTTNWRPFINLFCNNWFMLIQFQVMAIYLHSAIGKMFVNEWLNGTALYYWFNHPVFGMQHWLEPLVNPVVLNPYLAFSLTWGVMIFELYLGMAILIHKKHYKTLFKCAVGFHFLIILLHGLASFFISMSGALVLYFLVPWDMNKQQTKLIQPSFA